MVGFRCWFGEYTDFYVQLLQYGTLKQEASPKCKGDPDGTWPSEGLVTFDKVEFKYRRSLPAVLKGVSFDIRPGEKVRLVYICVAS